MSGSFGLKASVWILLLLSLSSSVFADLQFRGYNDVPLTSCQAGLLGVYLSNTGSQEITTVLNVTGPGSSFLTFVTPVFLFAPKTTTVVVTNVSIPCETPSGNYDLTLIARATDGSITRDAMTFVVTKPAFVEIVGETEIEASSCTPVKANFTLHNPNLNAVDYKVTLEGFNTSTGLQTIVTPKTTVKVAPNASLNTSVAFTLTDCMIFGDQKGALRVSSPSGDEFVTQSFALSVQPVQVPLLVSNPNQTIRSDKTATVFATVQNLGEEAANFSLRINGPTWLSVSDVMSFAPGEKKKIPITAAPVNVTGPIDLELVVSGEKTSLTVPLHLTVKPALQLPSKRIIILLAVFVIALLILALMIAAVVLAPVRNIVIVPIKSALARFSKWRKQRALAAERKKASKKELAKARQEQEQKKALAEQKLAEKYASKAEREIKKQYFLVPKEQTSRLRDVLFLIILICVIALVAGSLFFQIVHTVSIWVGAIAGAILGVWLLLFILYRMFTPWHYYYFGRQLPNEKFVISTRWAQGIGEFVLKSSVPLFKSYIYLKRRKSSPVFAKPRDVLEFVELKSKQVDLSEISGVVRFSLPRDKVAAWGQDTETIGLSVYKNNKWVSLQTTCVGQDKYNYFFDAPVEGLGHFAITCKKQIKHLSRTSWILPFGLIVAAILLITTLTVSVSSIGRFSLPDQPSVQGEIGPFVIANEMPAMVNLSQYFKDPDGDQLTFLYEPVEDVTITITDGLVKISPEAGFVGNRTTVFKAKDSQGSVISSNKVKIQSFATPEFTQEEKNAREIRKRAPAISAVLAAGILVMLWLMWRTRYDAAHPKQ